MRHSKRPKYTSFAIALPNRQPVGVGTSDFFYCLESEIREIIYSNQLMARQRRGEVAPLRWCPYERSPKSQCAVWISGGIWNTCEFPPKLSSRKLTHPWQYLEDPKIWVGSISAKESQKFMKALVWELIEIVYKNLASYAAKRHDKKCLEAVTAICEALLQEIDLLREHGSLVNIITCLLSTYKLLGKFEKIFLFYDEYGQHLVDLPWDDFKQDIEEFCEFIV